MPKTYNIVKKEALIGLSNFFKDDHLKCVLMIFAGLFSMFFNHFRILLLYDAVSKWQ